MERQQAVTVIAASWFPFASSAVIGAVIGTVIGTVIGAVIGAVIGLHERLEP